MRVVGVMSGRLPPLAILHTVLAAARDTRLTGNDINIIATISCYADDSGFVGFDDLGRSMSDTKTLAQTLGAGVSSMTRSLSHLEKLGYIQWERAWSFEKRAPIQGAVSKIRIIPSQTQSA
jgi:hypothetical protein